MRKRGFLIIGVGLVIIACLFFFVGHKGKRGEESLEKTKKKVPLLEAEGISLTEWDKKGEKTWELRADSGAKFIKKTVLNKVKVFFFQEKGLASEGETEKVFANNQTSDLVLQGGVKIISHLDGAELFTSNLRWSASERKLYTAEKVLLKRGNLIMEGRELVASPDLSQIVIKKEVTTRLIKIGGKI
ncbi:MAG: LPS export ABC transporter periplasmic protein LptC [Candidatus Aerophobetes bacterium]|nr:LPS export ABC transporter periplasmic protein LptC [Candidatus Aerophobetes bacterium]